MSGIGLGRFGAKSSATSVSPLEGSEATINQTKARKINPPVSVNLSREKRHQEDHASFSELDNDNGGFFDSYEDNRSMGSDHSMLDDDGFDEEAFADVASVFEDIETTTLDPAATATKPKSSFGFSRFTKKNQTNVVGGGVAAPPSSRSLTTNAANEKENHKTAKSSSRTTPPVKTGNARDTHASTINAIRTSQNVTRNASILTNTTNRKSTSATTIGTNARGTNQSVNRRTTAPINTMNDTSTSITTAAKGTHPNANRNKSNLVNSTNSRSISTSNNARTTSKITRTSINTSAFNVSKNNNSNSSHQVLRSKEPQRNQTTAPRVYEKRSNCWNYMPSAAESKSQSDPHNPAPRKESRRVSLDNVLAIPNRAVLGQVLQPRQNQNQNHNQQQGKREQRKALISSSSSLSDRLESSRSEHSHPHRQDNRSVSNNDRVTNSHQISNGFAPQKEAGGKRNGDHRLSSGPTPRKEGGNTTKVSQLKETPRQPNVTHNSGTEKRDSSKPVSVTPNAFPLREAHENENSPRSRETATELSCSSLASIPTAGHLQRKSGRNPRPNHRGQENDHVTVSMSNTARVATAVEDAPKADHPSIAQGTMKNRDGASTSHKHSDGNKAVKASSSKADEMEEDKDRDEDGFEYSQARFLSNIRETGDIQELIEADLLEANDRFAEHYALVLRDLDAAIDLMEKLDSVDKMADDILTRYSHVQDYNNTMSEEDATNYFY